MNASKPAAKMGSIFKAQTIFVIFLCLSNSISHNIDYHNVEYSTRLEKSDPFIDDFVPTEYTSGLLSKYDESVIIEGKVK